MTNTSSNQTAKTFKLLLVGMLLLILGVTLILVWWEEVTALFRGILGMILAVTGLAVLYWVKK